MMYCHSVCCPRVGGCDIMSVNKSRGLYTFLSYPVAELLNGSKICFDGFAAIGALYGILKTVTRPAYRLSTERVCSIVCCHWRYEQGCRVMRSWMPAVVPTTRKPRGQDQSFLPTPLHLSLLNVRHMHALHGEVITDFGRRRFHILLEDFIFDMQDAS